MVIELFIILHKMVLICTLNGTLVFQMKAIEQRFYITVYIYPLQGCPVFFFKSVNETLV